MTNELKVFQLELLLNTIINMGNVKHIITNHKISLGFICIVY